VGVYHSIYLAEAAHWDSWSDVEARRARRKLFLLTFKDKFRKSISPQKWFNEEPVN
jgi:hypothetical protein